VRFLLTRHFAFFRAITATPPTPTTHTKDLFAISTLENKPFHPKVHPLNMAMDERDTVTLFSNTDEDVDVPLHPSIV